MSRRAWVILAAALCGAALAGASLAFASSSGSARTHWGMPAAAHPSALAAPDITGAQKLVLTDRNEHEVDVDEGPKGFSAGDEVSIGADLFSGGTRVGTLDVHGAFTFVSRRAARGLFTFQATVRGSQISATGVAAFTANDGPNGFSAAVTGGTGKYRNARGQVRVQFLAHGARFTYFLLP
jgi:hypothetical protein